jgi:transposase
LYSSHLSTWRAARQRGELAGLTPRARGPKAKPVDPRDKTIAELERETCRLQARLERAEGLIAVQTKVAQLLGIPLANDENT